MKSERIKFIEELHTLIRKYKVSLCGEKLQLQFMDFERESAESNMYNLEFGNEWEARTTQEWTIKIVVKDMQSREILTIT